MQDAIDQMPEGGTSKQQAESRADTEEPNLAEHLGQRTFARGTAPPVDPPAAREAA
jgi:hypothetical protein